MNVSELARQLRIHPQKLLTILPEFGFDIGVRAVKIDDRVAQQIQRDWKRIKFVLEKKEKAEKEKQKELEKEARKSSGASVEIPSVLTVRELAERLSLPTTTLIKELMKNGILATQNENIDRDTAIILAEDLGFAVKQNENKVEDAVNEHIEGLETSLNAGNLQSRAPVVVVMGHVDHGKTSLLDAIRHTNVIAGEAGGITQHIGAYQVIWTNPKTKKKDNLTFIDTPGHEAFTVMRSRGAKVADIAILVVAADDSVKPQTVEAINIIKAAKLPFIVAINKIDKPGADGKKVRSDLSQHNILTDDWGGEVPVVEMSAKQKIGIDKLLDTILIVADMEEKNIKADPERPAAGTVIEAHVDKGAGPVATILVQTGTLRVNDPLIINGEIYGKVRALKNHRGENIESAPPSTPARILGLKIAPAVGDVLDLSRAGGAEQVNVRSKKSQQTGAEQTPIKPVDDEADENKHVLNVVVKADTLGSLEAIVGSLETIKNDEVSVKVVAKGLGNITADDATRAKTTDALLFAFNVTTNSESFEMIQNSEVKFFEYKVIYDLLNKVKEKLEELLVPEIITTELGNFKVVAIFRTNKGGMVVGGRVENGKLIKDSKLRVKRKGEEIGAGKLAGLQSGKQAVNQVPSGSECGLEFSGKLKLEEGDVLEAYTEEKKYKKLILK
ncbi:MAG: translation initiation factor IF-2 [Patescibacteria group bacterium]|jgi:translation initiation factor IF-2